MSALQHTVCLNSSPSLQMGADGGSTMSGSGIEVEVGGATDDVDDSGAGVGEDVGAT